jgi:hypothetical protein
MGLFGAKRVADATPAPMGYRVQRSMKQFMLLPTEVELFWEVFKRFDVSHEGFITTDTFFDKIIKEERTELGDAIFALVDTEDADKIEFGEFVQAICTFSMLSTDETLRFAFLVSLLLMIVFHSCETVLFALQNKAKVRLAHIKHEQQMYCMQHSQHICHAIAESVMHYFRTAQRAQSFLACCCDYLYSRSTIRTKVVCLRWKNCLIL